jgi:TusA-related sulfurtransferase
MEAICSWPAAETSPAAMTIEPGEVLDLLAQLVNKSLV